MSEPEKLNKNPEVGEDQIRIALSLGIIGIYWVLFKIIWDIPRPEKNYNMVLSMTNYFIVWLLNFLFGVCGVTIMFAFTIYLVGLTFKYSYSERLKKTSDKLNLPHLYDTGVSAFIGTLLISFYLSILMTCAFIITEYSSILSPKQKNLITWFPVLFLGLFFIKKINKMFKYLLCQLQLIIKKSCFLLIRFVLWAIRTLREGK